MCSSLRSDEESQGKHGQIILDYHPKAIDELIEAAQFYELRQTGLGDRFLDAIEAVLATIQENPFLWPEDKLRRRKCRVQKFPYLLIYKTSNKFAHILAVAHTSRKPGYWKSRDI